jgi:hypothetical protein
MAVIKIAGKWIVIPKKYGVFGVSSCIIVKLPFSGNVKHALWVNAHVELALRKFWVISQGISQGNFSAVEPGFADLCLVTRPRQPRISQT